MLKCPLPLLQVVTFSSSSLISGETSTAEPAERASVAVPWERGLVFTLGLYPWGCLVVVKMGSDIFPSPPSETEKLGDPKVYISLCKLKAGLRSGLLKLVFLASGGLFNCFSLLLSPLRGDLQFRGLCDTNADFYSSLHIPLGMEVRKQETGDVPFVLKSTNRSLKQKLFWIYSPLKPSLCDLAQVILPPLILSPFLYRAGTVVHCHSWVWGLCMKAFRIPKSTG